MHALSSRADFLEEEMETSCMSEEVSTTCCQLPDTGVLKYLLRQPHVECRSYNTIICHLSMESGLSRPSTGRGKPAPELCHKQVYICTKHTRPALFFTVLPGAKTSSKPLAWDRWTPVVEDHSSAPLAIRSHLSCHIPPLVPYTTYPIPLPYPLSPIGRLPCLVHYIKFSLKHFPSLSSVSPTPSCEHPENCNELASLAPNVLMFFSFCSTIPSGLFKVKPPTCSPSPDVGWLLCLAYLAPGIFLCSLLSRRLQKCQTV